MPHSDILDRQDSLNKPLVGSVVLHGGVAAILLFGGAVLSSNRETWGDTHPGGGSVAINVVNKIPLPARSGMVNPLANPTESAVPTPPPVAKPKKEVRKEDPDAVPLKSKAHQKPPEIAKSAQNTWRAKQQDRPNQLYSQAGQALVSPLYGQPGSGGVGVGEGSPLGNRFGNYVTILRQRVAEKWRTTDVDPRIHTLPVAIVTFDLHAGRFGKERADLADAAGIRLWITPRSAPFTMPVLFRRFRRPTNATTRASNSTSS